MSETERTNSPLVPIGTVQGPIKGEIARSFLESAGIPAVLRRNTLGSIYGLTTGVFGEVLVLVPEEFAEDARAIFAELSL